MHPRAQLTAAGVTVVRGVTTVLDSLDLTVSPGSRLAVVGENGRGKSTLLHVLAGALPPDRGTVRRVGTVGVAEQEMSTTDRRTVGEVVDAAIAEPLAALVRLDEAAHSLAGGDQAAEAAYAEALERAVALDAWDAERRVRVALEALAAETAPDRPLAELSVGQRYRVRLACLLGAEDDFLLLDEPTNHLDRSGLDFLTARLRARAGGVVLVSHDRALLRDVGETFVDLDPTRDARPRTFGGGYEGYRAGRRAELERWEQEHERQQAEHARLAESLDAAQDRLVSGWRPEKGSPKHGRATRAGGLVQAVHRRREALEAHAVDVPPPPQRLHLPELPGREGVALLRATGLAVDGRLAGAVDLALGAGQRLVVTGPNGAGKSTLLGVLAGDLAPTTGAVRLRPGTRVGHLRQESRLPADRRAHEVYATHVDALIASGRLLAGAAIGLSSLGLLRAGEATKRIGELSTGQQRRLDLALVLATRPHLLLLDEPTNHLSAALVDELTEALGATRAAVVLSTHDRQLLRDTAHWPRLELAPTSPVRCQHP